MVLKMKEMCSYRAAIGAAVTFSDTHRGGNDVE